MVIQRDSLVAYSYTTIFSDGPGLHNRFSDALELQAGFSDDLYASFVANRIT